MVLQQSSLDSKGPDGFKSSGGRLLGWLAQATFSPSAFSKLNHSCCPHVVGPCETLVGLLLGDEEGLCVGDEEGLLLGVDDGEVVGPTVGGDVAEGLFDGLWVGVEVGA